MERLGRYELLEELGRGAMGTVYRARDPKIDRIVAIKTISILRMTPGEELQYRQRFFREAQAAGQLSHQGIVTIYDVGEDEKTRTPFMVMEFVAGETLEALVSGERFPLEKALDIAHQVADALDYAHNQQIVHRDIKPANILVTPDGQAKITDFGIAKLQTQFTQTGQILGTPSYMSPEQVTGGHVDGRSDLFSLGVILYWMLTGDKPFTGETSTAISFKIVYKDIIPPSQLNPTLTGLTDYVVGRALAKDPARRYPTGRDFANDLDDLGTARPPRSMTSAPLDEIEGTVVAQHRLGPSLPARSSSAARTPDEGTAHAWIPIPAIRRRPWLWSTAAFLLLLGLGAGVAWQWNRGPEKATTSATGEGGSSPARGLPSSAPDSPAGLTRSPSGLRTSARGRQPSHSLGSQTPRSARSTPVAPGQPTSVLELSIDHNVDQGTLIVYLDDARSPLATLNLDRPADPSVPGPLPRISSSLRIPAGFHSISVRINAPRHALDEIRAIQGEFRPAETRRLQITVRKPRRLLGGDGLSLGWFD